MRACGLCVRFMRAREDKRVLACVVSGWVRGCGLRAAVDREYCSYCSLLFTCVCSSPKHALESIQLIWYLREYNQ